MRGNAQRYPDKRLSAMEAKAQMIAFLCNCRDEMLAAVTVDELCRRYRVGEREAEYQLILARQRRVA